MDVVYDSPVPPALLSTTVVKEQPGSGGGTRPMTTYDETRGA